MRTQAAAIEYVHLAKELQELADGRIDKIYADGEYVLWTVYTGERRVHLVLDVPIVAYLTTDKPSFGKASGYTMFLRKRLQGARIRRVEQVRMDRIIFFALETAEAKYHVYVELFGKGNLVVCDPEDTIISAMDATVYSDRSFKKGATYQPPEPQPDLRELSEEDFAARFGEREAVKVLAADLGLGGEYAELVCERAGVDKNTSDPDTRALYSEVRHLLEDYAPERLGDAAYPVHLFEDAEPFPTFSAAIASIRDPVREKAQREERKEALEKVENRVERIADSQEKQIEGFERSAQENQRKGEVLYERYQEVTAILAEAARDRKTLGPVAFKEKWSRHPLVASADPQDFALELD